MFSASLSLSSAAHALTALPLILLLASAMSAQDLDDVTLSGVVTDEHGALVVGAIVTAVPSTAGAARAVTTDGEGRYRLVELAPGAYTVRVTRDGFTAQERTGLATNAGQHVRLDFALRASGPEAEAVVVSASEAPQVDATRVVAGGSVGREELERLPSTSRSALDFVHALGGVSEQPLSKLYSEILYAYETTASVHAVDACVHTKSCMYMSFEFRAIVFLTADELEA